MISKSDGIDTPHTLQNPGSKDISAHDPFASPIVLIHVGHHKTGTTWLRNNLFPKAKGIVYRGDIGLSRSAFLIPDHDEFSSSHVYDIYREALDEARCRQLPLVISDEALGGLPFHQRFLREVVAQRIKTAFPSAKILITVREQNAIAASMYSEYLRFGGSANLREFLCQETGNQNFRPFLDLSFWEWDRTLRFYRSVFSEERVLAIPMEWGLSDPENYVRKIESFLGVPLDLNSTLNTSHKERLSRSSWSQWVLRHMNKFYPADTRYLYMKGWLKPNSVAYQIDLATPNWARSRGRRLQAETISGVVGDHFAKSNRRFADMTGFDLSALGYRVASSGQ